MRDVPARENISYLLKFSLEIAPYKKEIKTGGISGKNCADIGGETKRPGRVG